MGWDVVAICLGLFVWEVGAALVFLRLERGDGVNPGLLHLARTRR